MHNAFGQVTGKTKISESLSCPSQVSKSPKITKKPFCHFFDPPEPQPSPITTKTDIEVKHHDISLDTLAKVCYDIHYSYQGVRYAKNDQN